MPFVNDQAFIDALYAEPKKQYKPFQNKSLHKKEKVKEFKIKIKPELVDYINQVQEEVKSGLRTTVDFRGNSFKNGTKIIYIFNKN